jgi:ABC-type transport system involved in cytochrome c biogenesis permease subunit
MSSPTTTEPHAKGEFGEPAPRPATGPGPWHQVRKVLKPLASLQLTVVLFALGMGLIFFGTLAQIDYGIWTVVEKYFASFVVWVPFDLLNKFGSVFWHDQFSAAEPWKGTFPFPGGYLIGGLMIVNLLAAHALRFRLSWKRSGVLLIHSGLLLLFAGEFITREYAVEQQMTIPEGGGASYAEDTRNVELAVIDPSDPGVDHVSVISQKRLRSARPGERISSPDLPVDVEVVKYMKNSDFKDPGPGLEDPATAGSGKQVVAVEVPEESGVETKQRGDIASAYVKLYKKGTDESLGTYLTSILLSVQGVSEPVKAGDVTYRVALRRARHYKPYSIHLRDFRFDKYLGTTKAKNYSSEVVVRDAGGAIVRDNVVISMNHPLRYAGETFYQADFDKKTEKTTILQVVKNPGSLDLYFFHATIDYVACLVVGTGLVVHFLIYLVLFLRRLGGRERVALAGGSRYFPWIALGLGGLLLLGAAMRMAPPREPVNLDAFSRIPVVEGGRVKPLDTVARVYLRMVSHRETFVDENGKQQPAIRWYLDVLAARGLEDEKAGAWKHRVFRIENDQLRDELKLEPREGLRYSFDELRPQLRTLADKAIAIGEKNAAKKPLDKYEAKLLELWERLGLVQNLNRFQGQSLKDNKLLLLPPGAGGAEWESLADLRDGALQDAILAGMAEAQKEVLADPKRLDALTPQEERQLVEDLYGLDLDKMPPGMKLTRADVVKRAADELRQPPAAVPQRERRGWMLAMMDLLKEPRRAQAIRDKMRATSDAKIAAHPAAAAWEQMIAAYRDQKFNDFNRVAGEYRANFTSHVPAHDLVKSGAELVLNRFAPYYWCIWLYAIAFVLSVVGFAQHAAQRPRWGESLRRSSTYLLALAFAVHLLALVGRMYVQDRWFVFVTNLYSSAVFIGLGCVALGLVIERIYPIGVGNVLGGVLGLSTMIVAHNIASEDTLEMLVAVLDTNFWLATHVTTVTLGYTATFVAGFLGAFYVLQMLAAVVRDSFLKAGEPTVGDLLAFGTASMGVVGIPLSFLWFMRGALARFELLPSVLLWALFFAVAGAGVIYALTLMLLRVGSPGIDAHGQPVAGRVPGIAAPVAALALTPERAKIFGQLVYGVVCFATLLSFVGTVLGGIWADQSWGRFWGWDPKENGAVLIVLWNSLILHARWAGLVKDRGVAVLAVFGNCITAWSWFGTNQLSIGLHNYGFDSRLADGCFNFWVSQLFILALGLIPKRFWSRQPAAALAMAGVAPPKANGHPRDRRN